MATVTYRGGIASAMSVMLMLSILIGALPGVGTLTAGVVGGRMAGSTREAVLASFAPALFLAAMFTALVGLLSGMPLIGALAELGSLALVSVQVGGLLLGALIGGLLNH
ncbi:hypothetical protein SAMN04488038_114113 [Solimonas aquatica]|uniref:Uncharacterized protein n=1 Tax=Solimonas aquatica TaxID=489703 RepID=A0A1H9L047_9GAMM|nr:hypothetical protein [Solimonas aquatica]SER04688.1 hypothetical protein SAMN04488038_114113 [Solimonas aquatica]